MSSLDYVSLYGLVVRTLDLIDERLTGHNVRVAYRVYKACKKKGLYSYNELSEIIWVILLHDIGNFKHIDIEDLVERDNVKSVEHSLFGYAFIKEFTNFNKFASVVLYHHYSSFAIKQKIDDDKVLYTALVSAAADKLDLWKLSRSEDGDDASLSLIEALDGFDDNIIDDLIEIERELPNHFSMQEELKEALSYHPISVNETISLLNIVASSIDFRSRATALHCAIIVGVARSLACFCNVSPNDIDDIVIGAILHDLGKIATPLSILEGSTSLTDEEWEVMRNHVVVTEAILDGLVSDKIKHIAINHHERLDGKGYPHGVNGESLTLSDRIVCVSDVISALAQKRSYKKAFSLEDILKILISMANDNKIDKEIVDVVIKNKEELFKVIQEETSYVLDRYERINNYVLGNIKSY